MLEYEPSMEKKNSTRGATVPAKSLPNETKSKPDGSGGSAKFPRSCRRREGLVSKQDPTSKSTQQQRQRGCDKRYQTRNGIFPPSERHRNQIAIDDEAEIGSADRPGSKKLNLNHLLNFTYDRREGATATSNSWRSFNNQRGRAMWTTRKHKYNKEQFLQANCQFIVQGGRDYSVHSADPDLLVDWEWIEQVCVNSHEVPSCPICLYPPVAAKMTRCGHIYCWPCMLHYLALSDKTWRKCPICYEAVHKIDLKSVVALATPCFNVGDKITMQLMKRERGSVLAIPKVRWEKSVGQPFRMNEGIDHCYAKLLVASEQQVLEKIIGREEAELEDALEKHKKCPEICFVESAIEQLKERKMSSLSRVCSQKLDTSIDKEGIAELTSACAHDEFKDSSSDKALIEGIGSSDPLLEMGQTHLNDNSRDEAESLDGNELPTSPHGVNAKGAGKKPLGKDVFYFYQASDGQHIYMHAINVHMLVKEYGSLEMCPDVVTAVIVEKEGISMNEDLRRRLRYLSHLPLICEFEVVELKLVAPTVSQETIDAFAEEIEKRQQRRTRRAREERKREYQFQAEENRRLGKIPAACLRLNSLKHFPECNPKCEDEDATLSPDSIGGTVSSPTGQAISSSPNDGESLSGITNCGPSFAQMLSEGKVKNIPRFTSAAKGRGATAARERNASSDEDEGAMHAPAFRDSFCAALQDALDKSISMSVLGEHSDDNVATSKKKRGKQKKRLLFTTAVTRSK